MKHRARTCRRDGRFRGRSDGVRRRRIVDWRWHRRAANERRARSTADVASSESAVSGGRSIGCNHSGQQACGSQSKKIALHLISPWLPPHPSDKRNDRRRHCSSHVIAHLTHALACRDRHHTIAESPSKGPSTNITKRCANDCNCCSGSVMLREALLELSLAAFVAATVGGMMYFGAVALVAAPL